MKQSKEQREGQRFPIQLLASFTVEKTTGWGNGFTMDLSPKGCCLSVKAALPLWSRLNLLLRLPDDHSTITVDRAEVRWAMGNRCGIEFLSISRADQERLRRYLDQYEDLHRDDQTIHLSDLATGKRA